MNTYWISLPCDLLSSLASFQCSLLHHLHLSSDLGLSKYVNQHSHLNLSWNVRLPVLYDLDFNIYRFCHLPMGMSESPDITTEMIHSVLDSTEGIEFYMDDIGIFSSTWANHLSFLSTILTRLKEVGFMINPLKMRMGRARN